MTTPRVRARSAVATALALAVALGGCGGGSEDTTATVVAPATYVADVCRALLKWSGAGNAAFNASEESPDFDTSAGIRRQLLRYFDPLQDLTDELRARVGEAGIPDVPDGVGVARGLRSDVATAAARLEANRDAWAAIPLTDVQPAASIEATMTVLGQQLEAVHGSVERLRAHPALRPVWEREPACVEFARQRP